MTHVPATELPVRTYGQAGSPVFLIHGGPGAPGYLAPLARRLAGSFRVVEPFQRRSGGPPLTVARHVADLNDVVASVAPSRPLVIGHSWGAMLALAWAAAHPREDAALVLIGCGTFDKPSRDRLTAVRRERMTADIKGLESELLTKHADADIRLKALGALHQRIDSVDLLPHVDESERFDAQAHGETWADMLRLQNEGVYPAAFAAIRGPVLMLHGREDPHPGEMIRDGLKRHVPQMEYREFERCGHYPWLERAAHEEFCTSLRDWLMEQAAAGQ